MVAIINPLIVSEDVQPLIGPSDSPSMSAVIEKDRDQDPNQSVSLNSFRAFAFCSSVSGASPRCFGRTKVTTQNAAAIKMSWNQKSERHPNAAMIGLPRETPITGPPAPMSDHHPSAFTLSSGRKTLLMSAPDAVPVAAPWIPSSVRASNNMSTL